MNRFGISLLLLITTMISSAGFAQTQTIVKSDTSSISLEMPLIDYTSPKLYIINNIRTHGAAFFDEENLIASTGLVKGDSIYIPSSYLSQAINRLWLKSYFSDVKVVAEPVGDSVNLDIYLKETPRVYNWKFSGVKKGEQTDLKENLQLKRGAQLNDYVIYKNKELIKKFLREKGYLNAEVDVNIANDSVIQNSVNLTFVVTKGPKVKIGDIVFEGNDIFSDRQLRSSFKKTKKKNINIFKSSKYKAKEYDEDKENLIDFYNSKGYRNANIVKDSTYQINPKRIGLHLTVEEGNKYYFRDISWVGNSVFETAYLEQLLGIRKGDAYDKKTLLKRIGIGKESNPDDASISSLYQNDGYLMSQITPAEIIIGEDSIDLELKVSEGKPFTINNVQVTGNMRVNDEVIRRELYTHPGELYNRALLMQTIRQLSQMQHFNPEAIMPNINPVSNELVDITWPLEEQASDRFEISGGWGANMFVGSIGVELNNLSLKNIFSKGKGQWRPYPQGQSQQLRIRAQSNGSYYKQFSLSFTEPWLGGKKPNSLTVSSHYSDETDAYYMWQRGTKHFRTIGVSVGIGRRLSWPDQYFTIYNEISYQSYNLKDWDYFILKNGSSNIFALRTVFGRNSVDQPIYPRKGSDFSISLTLTPPYSLFDGKKYSDPKLSDNSRYNWIEYHKWQFKGLWYYSLTRDEKLVLMAKAEMGFIGNYDKNKPSPFEGFDVGGDGMSGYNVYGVDIIGLRGYENSSITPLSQNRDYARAYNKYTVEVRYPFILKPSSTIYGLVFAEGGNAFSTWKDFDPFALKRSLGLGVRMYLPVVGMIGVDWGYGFDKVPGKTEKSGGQFHFMIGMQF